MTDYIRKNIEEQREVLNALLGDETVLSAIKSVGEALAKTIESGGKILLCGNGGSAADAQHIAAELVGRFAKKDRPAIYAEALTVNTSSLTAIANDWGYDHLFERQVEAMGKKGDALVGITTSGNSANVLNAMKKGKELGLTTIGMTGADHDSAISTVSDHCINVPSTNTPRIQEAHILIGHILCERIEK